MPEFVASTPSTTLHVEVRGEGPAAVLLHGGPGICDYLSGSVMGPWLARGHTVIGYDQRGCRRSASSGPFTVEANLADLEAIRRHLNVEQVDLIGHSWGGLLGLFYAAAFPERVVGLTLIGAIGPHRGWEQAFQDTVDRRHSDAQRRRLARIDAEIARRRDRTEREELYRRRFNVALPSYMAPAHRDTPMEIESYSRRVNLETMADVHRSRYADSSWESGLAKLAGPITMIHGRQDPVPWSVVEDIQQLLPQARAILLEDCGHFPWLEVPDRCAAALGEALGGPS
jgi:proline iminopeptidase